MENPNLDPDVAVWGHDQQWHLTHRRTEFTLCGMGRGAFLEYRSDRIATCLDCISREAEGHEVLRQSMLLQSMLPWNI